MALRDPSGGIRDDVGTSKERGTREARRDSFWLTITYAVVSTAWVLLSDTALVALNLDERLEALLSASKGVAFVLITSFVLYVLSTRRLTRLYSTQVRASRLFERAGEVLIAIALERTGDGIVSDMVVTDANPVASERFRLPRQQLAGRRRSSLGSGDDRLRAYFDLVSFGVDSDDVVRSELSFSDGRHELGMAYQIESNLWMVAGMDVTALREAEFELRRQEERIRQAYVDVLDAVTGGKLVVMTDEEISEELGEPISERYRIDTPEQLADARRNIRVALSGTAPALAEGTEMLSAVGEALNNVLKHAKGGTYRLFSRDGRVQVCVSDAGPGIDFRTLPKATLVPGFSTAATLGMGFTIMLQLSDRVLLSTRPGQTAVVLEMSVAQAN